MTIRDAVIILRTKWLRLTAALAVVIVGTYSAPLPALAASQIPFTDSYQNGWLTLCNPQGKPVTSGTLETEPFAWKVVSSTPAPSGYSKAILYVYQPLPYVDPGDWTGDQMTDTSVFSNPSHPAVQATYVDEPLYPEVHRLPPEWNGLYELRFHYSAPKTPGYTNPYPAAVIKVTGNNWQLLSPTTAGCNAGGGFSEEVTFLPRSELETPHPFVVDNKPAGLGPNGRPVLNSRGEPAIIPPTQHINPATTVTSGSGSRVVAAAGAGASGGGTAGRGGGGDAWTVGIVAVAAVLLGGGAAVFMRRRLRRA